MVKPGLLKLLVFIAVIAAAALVAWRLGFFDLARPAQLAKTVRSLRGHTLIVPLFVLAYAVAATFGLPGSAFTLAGGAIFGFGVGVLLNWLGAVAGATTAFLLADVLCKDSCRSLLGRYSERLERNAKEHGFAATLRLRLIPLVPFNLLNFGAALAGVPFRPYVAATALGIIPATAVYTYFADSVLEGVAGASRHALLNVSIAGALLIAVSFVPTLVRRVRHDAGAS
jgi:uncharacterized membrane protein YdjX (TVP38/TMEM64 family)